MGENGASRLGEPQPVPRDFTPHCPHLAWLSDHLAGWQFGEQGLIPAIVDALDVPGIAIEYGAGDGELLPLTIDRIYDSGRECWLLELDELRRNSLRRIYPNAVVEKTIGRWDSIRGGAVAVVVIDIDGADSVVMREMLTAGVRPTLLVVEHMDRNVPIATSNPDPIPTWLLGHKLKSGHTIQDTAETLHAVAAKAGYERIGYNRCNSFFVVAERFTDLFR